mmetsp:Transcript_23083/g.33807  ORF Transcript_23083/g.33807 Transcript_23083/m.33807 type:complete len:214 (+) Transcript_23083:56-697(+)
MADSGKEVEEERNQGTEGDQEQLNDDELYGEEEEEVGDEEQMNEEVDPEFEEMKRRVQEMEEEQEKLTKLQQQVEKQINTAADGIDENSVYVGQVDYEATTDELRGHFAPCGTIKRVTILCDKFTGHAKGFAYVEFYDKASVENALRLDDSTFLGRQIKVLPKRHNVPIRGGRGRGGRGRGRGRGPPRGRGRGRGGYIRGGRSGGRGYYSSYY